MTTTRLLPSQGVDCKVAILNLNCRKHLSTYFRTVYPLRTPLPCARSHVVRRSGVHALVRDARHDLAVALELSPDPPSPVTHVYSRSEKKVSDTRALKVLEVLRSEF